ncbi:polyprenyl synthetase family protein [Parvibium lacunae]|uniref:Octaprenyl diphosphate synthase n=1 Tax=Parvibium lacunae TaxID=1888893 RepID=A0A368L1U3_9BURK|nr:polyprenyl synthetase family protein [Parvibium lacunae]RCS57536.1 octaprenyl diphosphate synthase [Parvibium lacunae]
MAAVDEVIRKRLLSEIPLISQVGDYIISAGGKRLRPALLLLLAQALGYQPAQEQHDTPKLHTLAAVIEFIHTATLLHDDVVDESALRRGRATANALFGNAASVLVGDFLYSRAFQMMVACDDMAVMRILADATNTIAEGEVLQLLNCNDPDVTEARYFQVIRFKTARLFEAAAEIAGILNGLPIDQIAQCAEFGRRIGTAFQLIDDVLDYSGAVEQIGKNVGDDLREGKPTLPLIYLLQHGEPALVNLVRSAILNGGSSEFDTILSAVQRSGALAYTQAAATDEIRLARTWLDSLPASPWQSSLQSLCDYSLARLS